MMTILAVVLVAFYMFELLLGLYFLVTSPNIQTMWIAVFNVPADGYKVLLKIPRWQPSPLALLIRDEELWTTESWMLFTAINQGHLRFHIPTRRGWKAILNGRYFS